MPGVQLNVERLCITNSEPELRKCVFPGKHEDRCDGWDYRWSSKMQDEVRTGMACDGCQPRPARHGYLCASCYGWVTSSMNGLPAFLKATEGLKKTITADAGGQSSALGFVPLSSLEMDLAVIDQFTASYTGNVDSWIMTPQGALDAVRSAQAIRGAMFRHPIKVTVENLDRVRCLRCQKLTLMVIPPAVPGVSETIKCRDKSCGFVASEADLELIVEAEQNVGGGPSPR